MRKITFVLFLFIITQAQGNLFSNNSFGGPPEAVLPSDETLGEISAVSEGRPRPGLRQAPDEDGAAQKEDAIPVGNTDIAIGITFLLSYAVVLYNKRKPVFNK